MKGPPFCTDEGYALEVPSRITRGFLLELLALYHKDHLANEHSEHIDPMRGIYCKPGWDHEPCGVCEVIERGRK